MENIIIDNNSAFLDNYEYDIEIDENAPRALQSDKIKLSMKPHQLACLYKALIMENKGLIKYNIKNLNEFFNITNVLYNRKINNCNNGFDGKLEVSTNLGIMGDIVGYGKTITALSIIASNNLDNIHINEENVRSYNNIKSYSYFTATCKNYVIPQKNIMINSTLVIVPRGPVYMQWEETIKKYTTLNYLAIDNLNFIKKKLPVYDGTNDNEIYDFFNKYDIVLIKNTTLKVFFDYYMYMGQYNIIKYWKRIMVDEAHDIINKIPLLKYYYLWLISGTYQELCKKNINSHFSLLYLIKDFLNDEYINLMLIKGTKQFVKNSFKVPVAIEKYYLCKLSVQLSAIRNFINPSVLEKINANDIAGAIKELGGKNETESNIIDLVTKEIKRDISNKEKEREYIESLEIHIDNKNTRLKNNENELNILNDKLKNLTERISELSTKICPICMDNYSNPVLLECTHSFCGSCLLNYINNNNDAKTCPMCRNNITPDKIIAITDKEITYPLEDDINKIYSKEDTFLNIIKNKPNGKFLVFSRIDNGFSKIIEKMNDNNIPYALLKGSTSHMINILNKFKNNEIKIILLNTQYAGSGIDINFATDVIIFHSMGLDKQQAVGRAQRVGRTDELYIHNLCYEHEMKN